LVFFDKNFFFKQEKLYRCFYTNYKIFIDLVFFLFKPYYEELYSYNAYNSYFYGEFGDFPSLKHSLIDLMSKYTGHTKLNFFKKFFRLAKAMDNKALADEKEKEEVGELDFKDLFYLSTILPEFVPFTKMRHIKDHWLAFDPDSLLVLEQLNSKGFFFKELYRSKFKRSRLLLGNFFFQRKDFASDLKFLKFLIMKSGTLQNFNNFKDFSLFFKKSNVDLKHKFNDYLLNA